LNNDLREYRHREIAEIITRNQAGAVIDSLELRDKLHGIGTGEELRIYENKIGPVERGFLTDRTATIYLYGLAVYLRFLANFESIRGIFLPNQPYYISRGTIWQA